MMSEVHAHIFEITVVSYEKAMGVSATPLLEEVGAVRGQAVGWNSFVRLLALFEERMGREAIISSLSQETLTNPLLEIVRGPLLMFASPEMYFQMLNNVTGPRLFPMIRSTWLHRSTGKILFELSLNKAEYLPCPLFFDISKRMFEQSYHAFGIQTARVRMTELDPGRRVLYEINSSPTRTLVSRIRDRITRTFSGQALALLEEQQQELIRNNDALETAHRELEDRVEERTRELAELNRVYEAQSQEKSRYLAQMTHELRTPMHSIILGVGLLRDSIETQDHSTLHADIELIEGSSQQLLQLVEDVLDMSRIEAGHLELMQEEVDPHALILGASQAMRGLLEASGNVLEVDLHSPATPLSLDAKRVRQILVNLLGNAAKFTNDGVITVRSTETPEDWILEVVDTGRGMDADMLERLFEPFKRDERDRHIVGAGLGLPISRELARLMGGDLFATSCPDVGSSFRLVLPLASLQP